MTQARGANWLWLTTLFAQCGRAGALDNGRMFSLRRRRRQPGWVALVPEAGELRLACVKPAREVGGRPRLRWLETLAGAEPAQVQGLSALRQRRQLDQRQLVALLRRGQYQVLTLEAPEAPREEWKSASRWLLQDRVDFPVDSAALDILEIPADAAQRRRPSLIAVAAARTAVLPLIDQGRAAGLDWAAIDIAETALRNISALLEEPGRGQALLHIGAEHSHLVVTAGGELLLSRQMEARQASLSQADPDLRQQAFERTSLELQRTLDGFERAFSQVSLARVLVSPALDDFIAYVGDLLYAPVQPLRLDEVLDLEAVPALQGNPQAQADWLCAIGAALRPSQAAVTP